MNALRTTLLLGTLCLWARGAPASAQALAAQAPAAAAASAAVPVPPSRVLATPHLARLLPPGTVAGRVSLGPTDAPVLARALLLPAGFASTPPPPEPRQHAPNSAGTVPDWKALLEPHEACWLALAIVEAGAHPGSGHAKAPGTGTLILARIRGTKAVAVSTTRRPARDITAIESCWVGAGSGPAAAVLPAISTSSTAPAAPGSGGSPAPGAAWLLGVQWAEGAAGRTGPLEAYALGSGQPVAIAHQVVDAFYFEAASKDSPPRMVVYAPEIDSLVILPQVEVWKDGILSPAQDAPAALEQRLLSEWEGVLADYRASAPKGDPPLLVLDVELLKGRLLARRGDARGAFLAFEELLKFVPGAMDLRVAHQAPVTRSDVLARVAEARRRAAALFGIAVQSKLEHH